MSIQTIMLVALGFLAASLLALLFAPAFWSRAVRLTTLRIKQSLPISEEEIRADRDRLRAEYAIRLHKLETDVERATLDRARHIIDVNKRDASIGSLEGKLDDLKGSLEEHENARRVLEQIVTTSLPRVEQRLTEAKSLLTVRDQEIAQLMQSAEKNRMALDEAATINAQQQSELERLTNALATRGARNMQALADPAFDAEVALRAEIEALRNRARDQANLIARLQGSAGAAAERDGAPAAVDATDGQMKPIRSGPIALDDAQAALEKDLRAAKSRIEDQNSEIARLAASLAAFESGEKTGGLKDSKIALKARLNSVEAQASKQAETIRALRAEIAESNERMALQTQHFMDEMRRLGAGTLPAASAARGAAVPVVVKPTLAERVAQATWTSGSGAVAAASVVANGHHKETETPHKNGAANGNGVEVTVEAEPATPAEPVDDSLPLPGERPRLLDRISRINKG